MLGSWEKPVRAQDMGRGSAFRAYASGRIEKYDEICEVPIVQLEKLQVHCPIVSFQEDCDDKTPTSMQTSVRWF